MNLKKNQNQRAHQPMFGHDPETGKRVLLPIKWSESHKSDSKVKSSEKKGKRNLLITPLHLTAADFEEPLATPNRAGKIRKTDNNSVRKELFSVQTKGPIARPSLNAKKRALLKINLPSRKTQMKKFKPNELSPLLNMDEVEEELINKKGFLQGYPFKTPSKPVIKFNDNLNNSPLRKQLKLDKKAARFPKIESTPDSSSSNETEFLELERICCEGDQGEMKSPISSVCNLLENTILNSTKKAKHSVTNIQQNLINSIEDILNDYETAFQDYKSNHEENISKITELLETDKKQYENLITLQNKQINSIKDILNSFKGDSDVISQSEVNKENTPIHNRRSIRLLNRSPVQSSGAKLILSPAILRSRDLRKSTLTKNLVTKTQQYNINSPRIKKALDMYNSMRCDMTVLATPKLDRSYLTETPSTNLSRNLSRRVQNQCVLLQDTPIHK